MKQYNVNTHEHKVFDIMHVLLKIARGCIENKNKASPSPSLS